MAYAIVRNLFKENKIVVENRKSLMDSIIDLLTREFEREDKLDQELKSLINDGQKQENMKKNIRHFARPDATEKILDEVLKLLER